MSPIDRVAELLEQRFGARAFTAVQRAELERAVVERARLHATDSATYVERLDGLADDELYALVGPLTNGWTWFFRDREDVVAALERHRARSSQTSIRVWVAGCSTGEEAYSVAILARELGLLPRVLASDVDASRLRTAREAIYAGATMRRIPGALIARYFTETAPGRFVVDRSIRECVQFARHNALDLPLRASDGARWDLVLCRNVLIHCTQEAAARIVERLQSALAERGELLLGAADRMGTSVARPVIGSLGPVSPLDRSAVESPERKVIALDPLAIAYARIDVGAFDDARGLLERIARQRPDDVDLHLLLGNAFVATHTFDRALDHYARAERLEPCEAEVHYLYGLVHRKRHDWDRASEALRRATFLDPTLWPAWLLLAGVWERLGDRERAQRARSTAHEAQLKRPWIAWRSRLEAFSVERARDTPLPADEAASPKRSSLP